MSSRNREEKERENILFVFFIYLSSNCTNVCMSMKEHRGGEREREKKENRMFKYEKKRFLKFFSFLR